MPFHKIYYYFLILQGLEFAAPLSGLLNAERERTRLLTKLKSVEADIAQLLKHMDSKGFRERARAQLVQESEQALAEKNAMRDRILDSLKVIDDLDC